MSVTWRMIQCRQVVKPVMVEYSRQTLAVTTVDKEAVTSIVFGDYEPVYTTLCDPQILGVFRMLVSVGILKHLPFSKKQESYGLHRLCAIRNYAYSTSAYDLN